MLLPKAWKLLDLNVFLIKALNQNFQFLQQDSSDLIKWNFFSYVDLFIFLMKSLQKRFMIRAYPQGSFLLKSIPLNISGTKKLCCKFREKKENLPGMADMCVGSRDWSNDKSEGSSFDSIV